MPHLKEQKIGELIHGSTNVLVIDCIDLYSQPNGSLISRSLFTTFSSKCQLQMRSRIHICFTYSLSLIELDDGTPLQLGVNLPHLNKFGELVQGSTIVFNDHIKATPHSLFTTFSFISQLQISSLIHIYYYLSSI